MSTTLNKDQIIQAFKLVPTGLKGWYNSHVPDKLVCPNCKKGTGGKVAIIFSDTVYSWKCVRCGAHGRLEGLLYKLGRKDLIPKYKDVVPVEEWTKNELFKTTTFDPFSEDLEKLPECPLPICFKRIYNSDYLNKRGCNKVIYQNWIIGTSDILKELKGYIIFVITEDKRCVGWVARSQKSKSEIKKLESEGKFILRWRNSQSDFSKIIFGIDEINDKTTTLIIVEGLTSKMNTDIQLELYNDDEIKCVCTFGKKISPIQIRKLKEKGKSVKRIILLYDSDAVAASKQTSLSLQNYFDEVLVGYKLSYNADGSERDAGDFTADEFEDIFNNLKTPFDFYENALQKKSLK